MRQLALLAACLFLLIGLFAVAPSLARHWLPQAFQFMDHNQALLQGIGCFVAIVVVVALGAWRARVGGQR